MYRLKIFILISLITSNMLLAQDFEKYPDYEFIVEKFFNEYAINDIPGVLEGKLDVNFAKKITGWHVILHDLNDKTDVIKNELFWNSKTKNYDKIKFQKLKNKEENKDHLAYALDNNFKNQYAECPFFGYVGWDWDVIEQFKDEKDLSEFLQFGLARAYSSYASNLLQNNTGFADKKHQFTLGQNKNTMSDEQLKKYLFYQHQAISMFEKVRDRNPKFNTIVGSIGLKASNEYINMFLDLRIFQNEEVAQKEIRAGIYSDFYVSMAKNYLNSCAPNAILFTNGDNDTYPLIYVQAQYGFRTDVLIVNLSLLNTDRYINSLRDKILDAAPLPITLTKEDIVGNKGALIYIVKEDSVAYELKEVIKFIKTETNVVETRSGGFYSYIPTNKFKLSSNNGSIEWEYNLNYLLRNKYVMLDLLATNNWERPIYFAISVGDDGYFGLESYLELEGLAYRLSPIKKTINDDEFGTVNSKEMYHKMMHNFDLPMLSKDDDINTLLCMNYRNNFSKLASTLIAENKKDSAKAVLDKCLKFLPNEIVYFDYLMLPIIECYYKIGDFELGNDIAKQYLININDKSGNYSTLNNEQKEYTRSQLESYAKSYNQPMLLELLKK